MSGEERHLPVTLQRFQSLVFIVEFVVRVTHGSFLSIAKHKKNLSLKGNCSRRESLKPRLIYAVIPHKPNALGFDLIILFYMYSLNKTSSKPFFTVRSMKRRMHKSKTLVW